MGSHLLPFDLLGGQHVTEPHIEGLAPQLAVAPLGGGGGGGAAPWAGRGPLRPALTAEADGALRGGGSHFIHISALLQQRRSGNQLSKTPFH